MTFAFSVPVSAKRRGRRIKLCWETFKFLIIHTEGFKKDEEVVNGDPGEFLPNLFRPPESRQLGNYESD